jgi:hypothetical protein
MRIKIKLTKLKLILLNLLKVVNNITKITWIIDSNNTFKYKKTNINKKIKYLICWCNLEYFLMNYRRQLQIN